MILPVCWTQNVLTLYFNVIEVVKYWTNDRGQIGELKQACEEYEICFDNHFTCSWVKEGFPFKIKKEGARMDVKSSLFSCWELQENTYFELQFLGKTLILYPNNRQQSWLLSHFMGQYLSKKGHNVLIEGWIENHVIKVSSEDNVKIVQILCQNKSFNHIRKVLEDLKNFLCHHCWNKNWIEELNYEEHEDNDTILRLLKPFVRAGLISVEEAEKLLCSVIQMFCNCKRQVALAQQGSDLLGTFVEANLISVETILLKLIKVTEDPNIKNPFIKRFTVANMFENVVTWRDEGSANSKKIRTFLMELLHSASDYDILAFALINLPHCHYTFKYYIEIVGAAKMLLLRLNADDRLTHQFSSQIKAFLKIIDDIQSTTITDEALYRSVDSLFKKLSIFIEDLKEFENVSMKSDSKIIEEIKIEDSFNADIQQVNYLSQHIENQELELNVIIEKESPEVVENNDDAKPEEVNIEESSNINTQQINHNSQQIENKELEQNAIIEKENPEVVKDNDSEKPEEVKIESSNISTQQINLVLIENIKVEEKLLNIIEELEVEKNIETNSITVSYDSTINKIMIYLLFALGCIYVINYFYNKDEI